MMTGLGLDSWAQRHPSQYNPRGGGWVGLGCGVLVDVERRLRDRPYDPAPECENWVGQWVDSARANGTEIAVVQMGTWEVTNQRRVGDDDWTNLTDPDLASDVRAVFEQGVDVLRAEGIAVVLVFFLPSSPAASTVSHPISCRSGFFPSPRWTLAPTVCLPSIGYSEFGWIW